MAVGNPITWFRRLHATFGLRTLVMLAIYQWVIKGYVYQGILGSMQKFYFGGVFRLPGTKIDIATTIVTMPYVLKPLIAIISDAFAILGYHKKHYILVVSILGTASLCLLSFMPGDSFNETIAILCYFLAVMQTAVIDILSEGAYAAEMRAHPEMAPDLMSYVWIGNYFTITIGSVISGPMIDHLSKSTSGIIGVQWVLFTAVPFAASAIFAAYYNLLGEPQTTKEEQRERRQKLWHQKELVFLSIMLGSFGIIYSCLGMVLSELGGAILISLFLFVTTISMWFLLTPIIGKYSIFCGIANCFSLLAVSGPAYYFYLDDETQYPDGPHFSAFFYNTVLMVSGNLFGMLALVVYARFMKTWTFRFVLGLTMPVFTLMNSLNIILFARLNKKWGINDHIFMFGDQALGQAATALLQQPGFLLVSKLCPKKLEATTYALLAGLGNFGMQVQGPIDAAINEGLGVTPDGSPNEGAKFDNLWLASVICNVLHVIPMFFLWCVPNIPQNETLLKEGEDDSAVKNSPFERMKARGLCGGKRKGKELSAETIDSETANAANEN